MKKSICLISSLLFLTSCTYAITMVHTAGSATDVVDETSTPTSSVSAPISATTLP